MPMKANKTFFEKRIGNSFHYQNTWMDRYAWETRTALFAKQFPDLQGKRVLDYGCGDGSYGLWFETLGARVLGLEQSSKLAQYTSIACITPTELPFVRNFDLITMFTVFNFILPKHRPGVIRNCLKALKPKGKLVILDYFPNKVPKYQMNLPHKEVWTETQTEDCLYGNGIRQIETISLNWVDTTLFHYLGGNPITYAITKFLDTHFMFEPKYKMLICQKI